MEKETSEIVKLTERISKDPKSKLFVPLAEEYKKSGDLEMAIHVLSEGLKNNPTYITARSVLGKLLLEKGDLAASQKEFEEVVRAIPDNLMAQRKLADLYVLQDRRDEALKHYKIVLSLTPKNEEVSSLISDLESGRDVSARLSQPKSLSSLKKPVKQESPAPHSAQARPSEPPASAPESRAVSAPAVPAAVKTEVSETIESKSPEPEPEIAPQASVPETKISTDAAVPAPSAKEDEPEDVLTMEPLDGVNTEPGASAPVYDFLAEKEPEMKPGPTEEAPAEVLFPVSDKVQAEPETAEPVLAEPVNIQEMGKQEPSISVEIPIEPGVFEKEMIQEMPQAGIPSESVEVVSASFPETSPAEAAKDISGKSDDFTTDTLAELYIGQGFFEKAIDIYQRMLADKPNSQGLKDKLERVRAMAVEAVSGQASPAEEIKDLTSVVDDIFSSSGTFEPSIAAEEKPIDAEILPEPGEYRPREETEKEKTEIKPVPAPKVSEPLAEEVVIEAEVLSEPKEYHPKIEAVEKKPEFGFFAEPREYRPPSEPEEPSTVQRESAADLFTFPPADVTARTEPKPVDFEPREYVSPKAGSRPVEPKVEQVVTAPQPQKEVKKETIDRLETWLRNIKKET
jgi:tetratricopeptide (TPR) repeat protein